VEKRRYRVVVYIVGKDFHFSDVYPSSDTLQTFPTCTAQHVVMDKHIMESHSFGQGFKTDQTALFA
jgi:hypothetical protein